MYFLGVVLVALILRELLYTYNVSLPIKYYASTDAYNYENIAVNLQRKFVDPNWKEFHIKNLKEKTPQIFIARTL